MTAHSNKNKYINSDSSGYVFGLSLVDHEPDIWTEHRRKMS